MDVDMTAKDDRDYDRDRDRDWGGDSGRSGCTDHWEPEEWRDGQRSRSRTRSWSSRRCSASPRDRGHSQRSRSHIRSRSPSRTRSRSRSRKPVDPFARSLGGPMSADHEKAVEFAKISKGEN
ncbi:hypothetical protein V8E55_007617 [Tylopilus felleus]